MRIATLVGLTLIGLTLVALTLVANPGQGVPVANYVIGPTDVLKVTIYGDPDLDNKIYTVDAYGMFSFPMVGRVQAAGLTVAQLEAALRNKLAPDYLRNPSVSAEVKVEVYDTAARQQFLANDLAPTDYVFDRAR